MKKAFMMIGLLIWICSCQQEIKHPDFNEVKSGMTTQQVEKLVGKPEKVKRMFFVVTWKYPKYSKSIVFNSDTVVEVLNDLNASADSVKKAVEGSVSGKSKDSASIEMRKALRSLQQ
ncbi:outer membrane protein assembly factor BamE domain-containing protein [Solitalea koreensis]|uniref:SmpA / OmlA family protein n=1 Tax=Solitalea koreensis TaxID=543615 RepID=A0A521B0R1_9SPHI|nr:outer membrane protein assembly factor BamE [Solitalea koreensis]SMO40688.1 SmpA / OmlA family protein [Solitalea koreensis]